MYFAKLVFRGWTSGSGAELLQFIVTGSILYNSRLVSRSSEDQASSLVSSVCDIDELSILNHDRWFTYDKVDLCEPWVGLRDETVWHGVAQCDENDGYDSVFLPSGLGENQLMDVIASDGVSTVNFLDVIYWSRSEGDAWWPLKKN